MRGRGRAQTRFLAEQTAGRTCDESDVRSRELGRLDTDEVSPRPHHRQPLFPAADPCPREPTMRSQRRWRGWCAGAGRCEGDCWGKEVDPAAGRSKTVLHVCLAASGLTPWSPQHTVRRCECRCHRLSVTPHPGCRLRARQATCYRVRPARRPGREKRKQRKGLEKWACVRLKSSLEDVSRGNCARRSRPASCAARG